MNIDEKVTIYTDTEKFKTIGYEEPVKEKKDLLNNKITTINTAPNISPQSNQKVKLIIITSIISVIILGIVVTLCVLLTKKEKNGESININPIKEELVVKLKRELNAASK